MSTSRPEALHPDIIEQAAQWMMRLGDGPDASMEQACQQWRQADARHELAWQRLQGISQNLNAAIGGSAAAPVAGQTILRYCERRSRRHAMKWMLGGVAAGSLGWLGLHEGLFDSADVYRTATGEQRVVNLPDGTVLTMNTGSVVKLRYDAQQRHIHLRRGEILISTAKDLAARPFTVETPNGLLTALGTRFTVRQMDDEAAATRLAVFEGAVRVEPADSASASQVLHAGEQVEFGRLNMSSPQPLQDAEPSWTQGMLVANRMRLDLFLQELSRYRPGVLRCDPEVAHLTVTGAFRIDDTDKALEVLAGVLKLRLRYRTRYWVSVGQA